MCGREHEMLSVVHATIFKERVKQKPEDGDLVTVTKHPNVNINEKFCFRQRGLAQFHVHFNILTRKVAGRSVHPATSPGPKRVDHLTGYL